MSHRNRNRSIWCCCLFLFTFTTILLTGPSGPALAELKDICRSFAVQPKSFAKLKFIKTKQYENKRSDVFIKFGASNQILSIFKYDDGQARITDAFVQEKLKSSLKAIDNSVAKRGDDIVSRGNPLVWKMGGCAIPRVVLPGNL